MATKTFAEYGYLGLLFGESSVREVESRDIEAAKADEKAEHAVWIRFYDREEAEIDGETLVGKPKNYSKTYMINGEPMTLEEVKRDHADERILISNMEGNGYDRVWKTTHGRFTQLPEDAVID